MWLYLRVWWSDFIAKIKAKFSKEGSTPIIVKALKVVNGTPSEVGVLPPEVTSQTGHTAGTITESVIENVIEAAVETTVETLPIGDHRDEYVELAKWLHSMGIIPKDKDPTEFLSEHTAEQIAHYKSLQNIFKG